MAALKAPAVAARDHIPVFVDILFGGKRRSRVLSSSWLNGRGVGVDDQEPLSFDIFRRQGADVHVEESKDLGTGTFIITGTPSMIMQDLAVESFVIGLQRSLAIIENGGAEQFLGLDDPFRRFIIQSEVAPVGIEIGKSQITTNAVDTASVSIEGVEVKGCEEEFETGKDTSVKLVVECGRHGRDSGLKRVLRVDKLDWRRNHSEVGDE